MDLEGLDWNTCGVYLNEERKVFEKGRFLAG